MDLPRGLGASLAEGEEKALAIEIVLEDRFAAIAAIRDVVDGAGIFDTKHGGPCGQDFGGDSTRQHENIRIWVTPSREGNANSPSD
jgi:hypothetical protein